MAEQKEVNTTLTNLWQDDEALHAQCKDFIQFIASLQKATSKLVDKEITQKRHDLLTSSQRQLRPHECWAVLGAAQKDFLAVLDALSDRCPGTLEPGQCVLVVQYLQAVIMLKHLQLPRVVERMTVTEWLSKRGCDGHYVIGVQDHVFALSEEEERWFDLYYRWVRPQLLRFNKKRTKKEKVDAEHRFLVSSAGKAIGNPSNDLFQLHLKYKLPTVNCQTARRVIETAAKSLTDTQRSLLTNYLTSSKETAKKRYRETRCDINVKTSQLLRSMSEVSSTDPSGEGVRHESSEGVSHHAGIKQPVIILQRLPSDHDTVKHLLSQ
ncbi:uncharacterized protein LOC134069442 [Sardina pilchardus]|uniref:uncharacterized protein LOC134069442 n=1 Tax=Sardina pilchardus TaxID=27697 RepID=UPI002E1187BF